MTINFTMPLDGSNDNYHHISAKIASWVSQTIANWHPGNKSFCREMFDVCFAMFGVTMSSQQNWK
jgi:hypothetical protein